MEPTSQFEVAYKFVKQWEGGYVNDAADPGGETKFGISKRAYPDVNIKDLNEDEAKAIYKKDYYDTLGCDGRTVDWAVAVFDTCVNCGLARTALWLEDAHHNLDYFLEHRRNHYKVISQKNPKLKKFLKGWLNRVNALHDYIESTKKLDVKSG